MLHGKSFLRKGFCKLIVLLQEFALEHAMVIDNGGLVVFWWLSVVENWLLSACEFERLKDHIMLDNNWILKQAENKKFSLSSKSITIWL